MTDAAVHDSQELDGLLDEGNTCNDVFADSAYRSAKIESNLRASGYNSRIHRRGRRKGEGWGQHRIAQWLNEQGVPTWAQPPAYTNPPIG